MRWVVVLLVVLLTVPLVSAIDMSPCPSSGQQNQNFVVGVSEAGATQVRLYYGGSWHVKSGSSATWTLTESSAGQKTYWGDAYVGGAWTSDGNDVCVVEIIEQTDSPGSLTFSVSPTNIESGAEFYYSVTYSDSDGTDEIEIRRDSANGQVVSSRSCSGTSCRQPSSGTLSTFPSSTTTYWAIGYDSNRNPTQKSRTVTVSGATLPLISGLSASPNPADINEQVEFSVLATDSGSDLSRIYINFGDGGSDDLSCSGNSCERTFYRTYTSSGTKSVYAYATDDAGHTSDNYNGNVVIEDVVSDTDSDGVPDGEDQCSGTPGGAQVVTTGAYIGCSCSQIIDFDPDPTRDTNPCTDDTCSIVGGSFVPVHTLVDDGTHPEGYTDGCSGDDWVDYFCSNGDVETETSTDDSRCLSCDDNDRQECWDGDPYWYDSCGNRQSPALDECGAGEQCVEDYPEAWCEEMTCDPDCEAPKVCGSPNDCNGFCDIESCSGDMSCEPSGNTYVCSYVCSSGDACVGNEPSCGTSIHLMTCNNGCQIETDCSENVGECMSGWCNQNDPECYTEMMIDGSECDIGVCLTGDCVECIDEGDCPNVACQQVSDCVNNDCVYTPIDPVCPASAACGVTPTPTNNCGECEMGTTCPSNQYCALFGTQWDCHSCGNSSHCGVGYWCDGGKCAANQVTITADKTSTVNIIEGSLLSVTYSLEPKNNDARLRVDGWPTDTTFLRTFTYTPKSIDVGLRSLVVEAFIPAEIFGEEEGLGDNADTPLSVRVSCNPNNKCCDQGDFLYKNNGEQCDFDNDGETDDGICQGTCVQNCIENYYTDCSQNDVYYFDSCDNRGDRSQDCSEEERCSVEEDGAECVLINQPCTGTAFYRCQNNQAQYIDECGYVSVEDTCTSFERCEANNEGAKCVAKGLCSDQPGTRECDNTCVDWLTNPNHCGGCNRACNSNELCDGGSCVVVEMCERVCGPTHPCPVGQVCINPDDCFHSECQAINVLEQTPGAVEDLSELLREGLIQVNTTIKGSDFHYRITNLAGTALTNISIETEFKKLIAASANDLYVKGVDYKIIKEDPILSFQIPSLKKNAEFVVSTPRLLTEADLALANILHITYTDILDLWNNTKDALTIGLNSEYDGENTKFHLTLNPNKGLDGVSVPLSIPKCMAKYASEMQLAGNFEIIQEDPLIVWQFDELNKPAEITFSVPGDIDEECKAQLKAMAFANRIGKPLNPWFAILIIPVIGILLIFFQRFSSDTTEHEKLSKKEFFALARSQNQSEEEIERAWHDYKRRF